MANKAGIVITQDQSQGYRRLIIGLAIVGGVLLVAGIAVVLVLSNFGSSNIHAFITPSNSMCPTLCEGERFFADLAAYSGHPPARGDVIAFEFEQTGKSNSLFSKRVIGVPGDTVSADGHGKILVNDKPLSLPCETSVCGKPIRSADPITEPVLFPTTMVPPGSLFVIGDNLANSYDSRYFGLVSDASVRGKLLLIYWSRGSGRIGCSIH